MIQTTTHFTKESIEYRKWVRKTIREVTGLSSSYRNKRTFGYTDKFYCGAFERKRLFALLDMLGVKYSNRYEMKNPCACGWGYGIIVYLPNQN